MNEPAGSAYVFEGFRLDAQRRVLSGPDGHPISLTPRVFDALLYLVERPGRLLTKEQLLHDLWPDVVVEEHNLNKTVSELRRVLGEKPGEHKFIVTKPGRGYRFVADVSMEKRAEGTPRSSGSADVAPPPEGIASRASASTAALPGSADRRYPVWRLAFFATVLFGAGIALVGTRVFEPAEPQLRLRPWSAEKGGQRAPVWSPDGNATAFVARASASEPWQLYVRELDAPAARPIARLIGTQPATVSQWTTAGKILFWDQGGLWSVSPVGAPAELLAPIDFRRYASVPGLSAHVTQDGAFVATVGRSEDGGAAGVYTAALPAAKFERYEPDPFTTRVIHNIPHLRFSPDGKQLLLWWNAGRDGEEAWLMPFPPRASAPPRRVLEELPIPNGTPDFSWLPDNRHIVVTAGESGRMLYFADTQTGRFSPIVGGLVGPSFQAAPVMSPAGDKLIYTDRRPDLDVVTLDLTSARVAPLIVSDRNEEMPAWAARSKRLVYVTNRTAEVEIWLHDPPQPDRPLVTASDFQSQTEYFVAPTLSPDGARVIYQRVEGPQGKSSALWMSAVDGGAPERVTNRSTPEFGGSWSPDGAWYVYIAGGQNGIPSISKVKTTGQAEPQILLERPSNRFGDWPPIWSPDGHWILQGGVLLAADGSTTRDLGVAGVACAFAGTEPLLYCLLEPASDGRHPFVALDFDGKVVRNIGSVSPDRMPAATYRPSLRLSPTPNGAGLTYSVSNLTANLWLMEGLDDVSLP